MKNLLLNKVLFSSTLLLACTLADASSLSLATKPLYTGTTEAPMMMLVMGRDHTLYYEAYNDASDLDGDGVLDIKFMPDYSYEGYFNPETCYEYESSMFVPSKAATSDNHVCQDSDSPWSGNFLNYLTMTRMDVLRKVLYGGARSIDSASETVLERVFIPQDAHSWAKAYTSEDVDGYDIRDYTNLELPSSNKQHFFGSVTYTGYNAAPILRVRQNANSGVWNWASTERPVLNNSGTDYTVRVKVCVEGLLESNCELYPNGSYKPTGLLHDYGANDQMLFGLLTGSYNKNLSGGVLREVVKEFSDELDANTGQFTSHDNGIVATINKLKIHGFNYSDKTHNTNCGWIPNRAINEGECASWGNPVGEMLYEAMRYFAGEKAASGSYSYEKSSHQYDQSLNLPAPSWDDPYDGRGTCSRPNTLLISDINPSYDSDQLPGAYSEFASTYNGSTLTADDGNNFNISTLLSTISATEGKTSGEYFIGQSGSYTDNAPTVKAISGLGTIRGLAPAEPTKQGSYSSAGVAYFGLNNDINADKPEEQHVTTMVVALASNLPEISVDIDGQEIKIIPFAKTVKGHYGGVINSLEGYFQPTNTIVDWYVESISPTKGVFRINFEDVEQGADHDMDMIVTYTYEVKDICTKSSNGQCKSDHKEKGVEITLDSSYAAGSFVQHAGYIISGTTNDGMYLEVKDSATNNKGEDYLYYLDTPNTDVYQNRKDSGSTAELPYYASRNFFPSSSDAAEFLPSPLWYAAKWGGFTDSNNNGLPDLTSEWDADGDGKPDNYFPVTNAGELKNQLSAAFDLAYEGTVTGSAPVFSSNFLISGTLVYQSSFEEITWSGNVNAYVTDRNGVYPTIPSWSAATKLDAMTWSNRKIFSRNDTTGKVFQFETPDSLNGSDNSFSKYQLSELLGDRSGNKKLSYVKATVDYIRGDRTHEASGSTYDLRKRSSVLGDIINSTPYYVASANGHDVKKDLLVFGANDGMVHIVDATDGNEVAAYVPSGVYDALGSYVKSGYIHEYSVDGGINAYSEEQDSGIVKTTLVGRLGLGVKGLYAIDVSDMRTPNSSMMKWEITPQSAGYEGLGYSVSAPTMAKLANGDVSVIFANGYNSVNKDGAIYIANAEDGRLIKRLSVGTQSDPTGADRANAFAQPALIDNDGNGIADHIYVGDLFGNMWVFDISSSDVNQWGNNIDGNKPLFTTSSPTESDDGSLMSQPITTRPSVARHPSGTGVLVAFGTGKYIESSDKSVDNQATQSFYVIADMLDGSVVTAARDRANGNKFTNTGSAANKLGNLQNQTIVNESATNRLLSTNSVDWANVSGFYLDLINTYEGNLDNKGERQVGNSSVFANKVSFITLMPSVDPCVVGGTGWYMELNLYTGKSWNPGTPSVDDPSTPEDESLEVPDDGSNKFLDGVGTGMTTVASPKTEFVENEDGSTSEVISNGSTQLQTCITLSTGKVVCFPDDMKLTGRLSWRHLY
ncbi:fimbrial assembly protein [Psychromonas sp. RZ22]|uniref:pilus assembly protein n=1 Tax=Psychromonas algarum TaxID=2555643 RepID=UPI001067333E|nr:PilC/PilY family type IV pilus protein [Psychromonas sp. RZ22]TEW56781.1 fimbrial assembly protein [Psychromonas sp. RZ22]